MKNKNCVLCGIALKIDEVALSRKMLGRKIVSFYCINCLAAELEVDAEDLKIKIEEFREQGCALFL
jgi:hypothetical protein